jgi:hypothetical protein
MLSNVALEGRVPANTSPWARWRSSAASAECPDEQLQSNVEHIGQNPSDSSAVTMQRVSGAVE